MIRRPPRSTLDRSSAASDVYKRQGVVTLPEGTEMVMPGDNVAVDVELIVPIAMEDKPVSYTHLRAHETVLDLVCRLLLEKKHRSITTHVHYTSSDADAHTTHPPAQYDTHETR